MPCDSLYPPVEIPETDIWGFLFERQDRPFSADKSTSCQHMNLPNRLLINELVIYTDTETNESLTFAQVKEIAAEFGKGLKATWDWKKGDVMAMFTPNCLDFPPFIWGVHWAGGVCSPANPGYTTDELAFQLKDTGAKALATHKQCLPVALDAAQKVGLAPDRIILLGDERDDSMRTKHYTSIRNLAGTNRYRRAKINPRQDLAFLVYSSGTTGLPKGVMLSHRNIIANILQQKTAEGGNLSWEGGLHGEGDRLLAFLPFFHVYGLVCLIHQAMFSGLRLFIMAKFDLEKFCRIIQEQQITFAYIVPPVVLLLGKHPIVDKYDLSSLRMMNSGAAPLTKDIVDLVYTRTHIPIKQGYGLSETSPTTHNQPWHLWDKPIGSIGTLLPNLSAKFMSPDGKEVADGETGELWVKGPNVFQGYLNNPEASANSITSDGYFKTGDVGHRDENGNFFITDRVKELIKYKGFQVAPAELEGLLLGHPAVNDVAVIGMYDETLASEVPRAYIVIKSGLERSPQRSTEIASWLQARVANHKKLRGGVNFVDDIPKSASGKILRRVLKARAKEEQAKAIRAKL